MAKIFAEHYGLLEFAGSDNHSGANQPKLAGVSFTDPISSIQDFIQKVKNKKAKIFTITNNAQG
jgi:hypothetical protein